MTGSGARVCGECVEDMLDRLEQRELTSSELQHAVVLDARLEQWTSRQCVRHRQLVRAELTQHFESELISAAPRTEQNNSSVDAEQARQLSHRLQGLYQVNAARLSEEEAIQHVQELSRVEADLREFESHLTGQLATPASETEDQSLFHSGNWPTSLFPEPELLFQRSDWPLPLGLAPWPTSRMRRREQILLRERRREALLVQEEFELRRASMNRAREAQQQRELERQRIRLQEEEQRRQAEIQAEERRRRAQELDELARRAVAQMVGHGTARMCRRCRSGPVMNENCSNLATHNRDTVNRRNANHCPRCGWFDRNWQNWPEWDGIDGPH